MSNHFGYFDDQMSGLSLVYAALIEHSKRKYAPLVSLCVSQKTFKRIEEDLAALSNKDFQGSLEIVLPNSNKAISISVLIDDETPDNEVDGLILDDAMIQ